MRDTEGEGPPLDEQLYPFTEAANWAPLERYFAATPDECNAYMFMCQTLEGVAYYKHSLTRETLALSAVE